MKKRIVAIVLGSMLALSTLAGCGRKPAVVSDVPIEVPSEIPAEALTEVPTEAPTEAGPTEEAPVETPTETAIEEPMIEEPAEEPAGEAAETSASVSELSVPKGYEEYTYGGAPLSSIYTLLYYEYEMDPENAMDISALSEASPEEFIEALDQQIEIDPKDEDAEQQRQFCIVIELGFSGLTDGSDEQKEGFFNGTWVPDGTIYQ